MARDITELLGKGVAHVMSGGTVDDYMHQVSRERLSAAEERELRALLHTAAGLRQFRQAPVPAPRAKVVNRARFLGEAIRLREERRTGRIRLPWLEVPVRAWRGLVALLLVVVLLAGGSTMVNVAAKSLPGSSLYPVKLVLEDTQLLLALRQAQRAELNLRFANERANELVQLGIAGRPLDRAVVERMARQLQGALESAQASGPETGVELLRQVITVSTRQEQVLVQISAEAPPEVQPVLAAGAVVARETAQQAQEALTGLIVSLPTATATRVSVVVPSSPVAVRPSVTHTPLPPPSPTEPPPQATEPEPQPTNTTVAEVVPTPIPPGETPESVRTRTPPSLVTPTEALPAETPGAALTAVAPARTGTPMVTVTTTRRVTPTATDALTTTQTATSSPTTTRTPTGTATPTQPAPTETPAPPTETPLPTLTPTPTPLAISVILDDSPDPVPASYRIHFVACAINDSGVPLTNAVLVVRWSPTDCAYLPPDYPTQLTFALGSLSPYSRSCVRFSLNTSVICSGQVIVSEAVLTCDQGTARDQETTQIGPAPTPTRTVTPTPQTRFALTVKDHPDPVPAGSNIYYDICVSNNGDSPLTNVVVVDRWSPRDCVYVLPDNPPEVRWYLGEVGPRTQRCVQLTLRTFTICAGTVVTNEALLTCDQGTAREEERTTIGPPPTAAPTQTATPLPSPTPTPAPTATPSATATITPVPTLTDTPTPTPTGTLVSR